MRALPRFLAPVLAVSAVLIAADARGGDRGNPGGGYQGGGRHWSGGGYRHGGRGFWPGSHYGYWGPRYWAWGVPLVWGAAWGWPYYDYSYYPRETVIYPEVPAYPEGTMLAPTTEAPPIEGTPAGTPLYLNYCESARAYYPKVTACPEGWRLAPPPG